MKKVKPEITLFAQVSDIPVRGNAMVSGDDKFDRQVEDEIIARLEDGDVWAWADVEVRAEYDGLSASDYLGACNYASEDDFKADGYYCDIVKEATRQLADKLAELQGLEIEK